jgi:negative regulator of flagellin synthesis FlgM
LYEAALLVVLESTMKIGQPTDNQIMNSAAAQSALSKSGQGPGVAVSSAASMAPAGIEVTVSSLARSLATPGQGDTPDVDLAKVDAMKTALRNGQFQVNPEAIADKLLSNAQEMLTRQR